MQGGVEELERLLTRLAMTKVFGPPEQTGKNDRKQRMQQGVIALMRAHHMSDGLTSHEIYKHMQSVGQRPVALPLTEDDISRLIEPERLDINEELVDGAFQRTSAKATAHARKPHEAAAASPSPTAATDAPGSRKWQMANGKKRLNTVADPWEFRSRKSEAESRERGGSWTSVVMRGDESYRGRRLVGPRERRKEKTYEEIAEEEARQRVIKSYGASAMRHWMENKGYALPEYLEKANRDEGSKSPGRTSPASPGRKSTAGPRRRGSPSRSQARSVISGTR